MEERNCASLTVFSTVTITNGCVLTSRRPLSLEVYLNGVVDTWVDG